MRVRISVLGLLPVGLATVFVATFLAACGGGGGGGGSAPETPETLGRVSLISSYAAKRAWSVTLASIQTATRSADLPNSEELRYDQVIRQYYRKYNTSNGGRVEFYSDSFGQNRTGTLLYSKTIQGTFETLQATLSVSSPKSFSLNITLSGERDSTQGQVNIRYEDGITTGQCSINGSLDVSNPSSWRFAGELTCTACGLTVKLRNPSFNPTLGRLAGSVESFRLQGNVDYNYETDRGQIIFTTSRGPMRIDFNGDQVQVDHDDFQFNFNIEQIEEDLENCN